MKLRYYLPILLSLLLTTNMLANTKLSDIDFSNIDVTILSYQREILMEWEAPKSSGKIEWKIIVNDTKEYDLGQQTSFVITRLKPETEYSIKIQAIVGSKVHDVLSESITTDFFGKGKDDLTRIPYLRTIANGTNKFGNVPKTIKLYFTDLANPNAEIQYFIDGKEIQPIGDSLTFPKSGKLRLKIIIKEDEQHIWELEYFLTVYQH